MILNPYIYATSYTYFRLTITANNGDASFTGIRELELRESIGGANALSSRTRTVTTSSRTVGYEGTKAFDDSYVDGNGWVTSSGNTTGWIKVQVDTAITPMEYAIGGYPTTTSTAARSAKNWTLEGSNNGTDWTTLDSQTNITWTGWTFTTPKVYSV